LAFFSVSSDGAAGALFTGAAGVVVVVVVVEVEEELELAGGGDAGVSCAQTGTVAIITLRNRE
jgi:hypothetical protein